MIATAPDQADILRIAQRLARMTTPRLWWGQLPQDAQLTFIREAERVIASERDHREMPDAGPRQLELV